MGREASVYVEVGREVGEARALLESSELILRGEVRRRLPKASMEDVSVDGDLLRLRVAGETITLHLGAKLAQSWASAIAKPPPSLRAKLGLGNGARALLVGEIADGALAEATEGLLVTDGAMAQMMIAVIDSPSDLVNAQRIHAGFPGMPLWTVYAKGRGVAFGEAAIRAMLREAGFRDTKSCAVSDRLTATRYSL